MTHTLESLLNLAAELGAASVNHYLANEQDKDKWQKMVDANTDLSAALSEVLAERDALAKDARGIGGCVRTRPTLDGSMTSALMKLTAASTPP